MKNISPINLIDKLNIIFEKSSEKRLNAVDNLIEQILKSYDFGIKKIENIKTFYNNVKENFLNTLYNLTNVKEVYFNNREKVCKYIEYIKSTDQNELTLIEKSGNILYMLNSLLKMKYVDINSSSLSVYFNKEDELNPSFWLEDIEYLNFSNLIYQILNKLNIECLTEYFQYLNDNKENITNLTEQEIAIIADNFFNIIIKHRGLIAFYSSDNDYINFSKEYQIKNIKLVIDYLIL